MARGLFITGTDTGVGKTLVAVGLIVVLRERGFDTGVMKPVESGCLGKDGRVIPKDAILLRKISRCRDELEIINPYKFNEPLAPALAADREGVEVRLEVIGRAYDLLASSHEIVIVEGAGGILSPVFGGCFMADLARRWGLPILIVTGAELGTINHTLLTLYYAQRQGIPVLGVVMNHTSSQEGLAESLNDIAIQRWIDVPFLGSIPFLTDLDEEAIKRAIEKNLDLWPIDEFLNRKR